MNTVNIIGRLTRDAEMKYTTSGTAMSKFSIAVDRWNGTEKVANFFDCTIWGKRAEALGQYLTKGSQVGVSGELVQNRWEQNGQKRSKVEISARDITLLGKKEGAKLSPDTANQMADNFVDDKIPF